MATHMVLSTVLLYLQLASTHAISADAISSSQSVDTAHANLTDLTCFPANQDAPPPIPERNCLAALQAFTAEHNETTYGEIIFTTNRSLWSNPSPTNPYLATPTEFAPVTEPVEPDNATIACILVYAVYYGAMPIDQRPDANVTLRALEQATDRVVEHCTDANPRFAGNGGSVVLTNDLGQQIDVTVQRPV